MRQLECVAALFLTLTGALLAAPSPELASAPAAEPARKHGPQARADQFSHVFQPRPHLPQRPQLSFHYGLLQPVLLGGFNAAVDFRYKRFIATYSHGHGLDIDRIPGTLTSGERAAGAEVFMPYTTGAGFGIVLVDELYILADAKVHAYDARGADTVRRYHTVTVGAELGWRLFLWKGLHVAPVIRYWPNVYSSLPKAGVDLGDGAVHRSLKQGAGGFFANVLIGWQFGL